MLNLCHSNCPDQTVLYEFQLCNHQTGSVGQDPCDPIGSVSLRAKASAKVGLKSSTKVRVQGFFVSWCSQRGFRFSWMFVVWSVFAVGEQRRRAFWSMKQLLFDQLCGGTGQGLAGSVQMNPGEQLTADVFLAAASPGLSGELWQWVCACSSGPMSWFCGCEADSAHQTALASKPASHSQKSCAY